jgi:hypothetical protein
LIFDFFLFSFLSSDGVIVYLSVARLKSVYHSSTCFWRKWVLLLLHFQFF